MKTAFGFLALLLAVQFCCCGGWLTPTPTAPAEQPAQACSPTNMVGWPLDYVTAEGGCVYKAPQSSNSPAEQPAAPVSNTVTFTCDGVSLVYPAGSVVFPFNVWRDNVAYHDCHYDVVFDPSQSGYFGVKPNGWAHQPWLPGSHREYHEGAIIMPAEMVRYLGPECRVYRNSAGNDSTGGFNGQLLLDHANGMTDIRLSATPGQGKEVWLWVACEESDAGGFSMSVIK